MQAGLLRRNEMFHAKMHDEDDDELPGFDEDEEGPEQSPEIVEVE